MGGGGHHAQPTMGGGAPGGAHMTDETNVRLVGSLLRRGGLLRSVSSVSDRLPKEEGAREAKGNMSTAWVRTTEAKPGAPLSVSEVKLRSRSVPLPVVASSLDTKISPPVQVAWSSSHVVTSSSPGAQPSSGSSGPTASVSVRTADSAVVHAFLQRTSPTDPTARSGPLPSAADSQPLSLSPTAPAGAPPLPSSALSDGAVGPPVDQPTLLQHASHPTKDRMPSFQELIFASLQLPLSIPQLPALAPMDSGSPPHPSSVPSPDATASGGALASLHPTPPPLPVVWRASSTPATASPTIPDAHIAGHVTPHGVEGAAHVVEVTAQSSAQHASRRAIEPFRRDMGRRGVQPPRRFQ